MTELSPLAAQLTNPSLLNEAQVPVSNQADSGFDSFEEVYDLERRFRALTFIRSCYNLPGLTPTQRALAPITNPMHGVDQIGNQFAPRLLDAYLTENPVEALYKFRDIEFSTTDQQMALLVNDEQFANIHADLRNHLDQTDEEIRAEVSERLEPKGQIAWNDRKQFEGNEGNRSLRKMLINGITLAIQQGQGALIDIAQDKVGTGPLPLTEILKNEKMLVINGLKDSKISLAVHDAMDHAWLFNLMHQIGLHKKFEDFFQSIGDPSYTDIYKREGEIVASVGFGVRCGAAQEPGFVPIYDAEIIRRYFEEYFDQGILLDRHMDAFRILRQLSPHSREWQSLGFTYSNNVVELDEQKRKHGKIKVRDPESHEIKGVFSETDRDYLALFVELHHQLHQSRNKTRNNLFRFHILLEEYLQGIANNTISPDVPMNVKVQHLEQYSAEETTVPADRLRWMFRNYGFTATKDNWV